MVDRQNIFNRDFYPTPESVIEQMLKLTDVRGKIVLEPSAGSGNIVNFCKNRGAREVIACEINDKLRAIVAGKCRVIASDFLEVTADMVSHVDLIVMNPPFSAEEKHILHAYEIAPEGCEVISLCNNSMLSYSHTENSRKVNELINLYGSSEYLGNVFTSAERTTDVSVSVLRLYKPKTGEHEFDDFFDLPDGVCGDDSLENLNPSCRMCNFRKSTGSLEYFRDAIKHSLVCLERSFTYRLAKRYGLVKEIPQNVEFYFEKYESK